ncbi:DUF4113 domain-containing protein [Pseudogemmobacter sp. W21_MBD1_M6]|uniref:DUF4113 domain-containing protein n=1 Tax=Pseudogemmobacter sp. W21_MBD1_M6 TaxID=3240271 RepID=UPI003F99327A
MQRTSALRPSCRNVHGAASVTTGPFCRSFPFTKHPARLFGNHRSPRYTTRISDLPVVR